MHLRRIYAHTGDFEFREQSPVKDCAMETRGQMESAALPSI